jgi:cytidylate kinase
MLSGPAITIAHQTGSGAHEIAERLAQLFQETEPDDAWPWMVLDRQIVEKALEEHHWPRELARKMPEDRRSYLADTLDDLFGLRPPSWVLVPQVVETLRRLAKAGRVILIGHGATLVTSQISQVFRVRLIASLTMRIKRVQQSRNLTAEAAVQLVKREDRGRERYVRANFHARLDDDLLYHLVINTDRLPCADAARLIAEEAKRCFARASQAVARA